MLASTAWPVFFIIINGVDWLLPPLIMVVKKQQHIEVTGHGSKLVVEILCVCHVQFPALFSTYAALLAYMAEIHASRLCRLPDDLLHHLMASVDLGLTSDAGPDIAKACLELVASLAAHVCTDPALHGTMVHQVGAHFLEVLLR